MDLGKEKGLPKGNPYQPSGVLSRPELCGVNGFGEVNLNNNNNNNSNDGLEDIRPEITPEGYGLRTPYGTHLSLDFLKFCQDIGRNPHSPTNKTELNSRTSTKNVEPPGSQQGGEGRLTASNHLSETRRRLEAYRSFRVKRPKGTSQQNDLEKVSKLSDESAPPSDGQPLKTVREQMAAALTRLKHLENQVRQVPILQVQLSILQQEKQKLQSELQKYKDKKPDDRSYNTYQSESSPESTAKQISNSVPPPPPKRRYKSVSVGCDSALDLNLPPEPKETKDAGCHADIKSGVDVDVQVHAQMCDASCGGGVLRNTKSSSTSTLDIWPTKISVDACVGQSVSSTSKYVSTEKITSHEVFTSSQDLIIRQETASGGDHPVSFKSQATMTYVQEHHKACQAPQVLDWTDSLYEANVIPRPSFASIGCQHVESEKKEKGVATEVVRKFDVCVGNFSVLAEASTNTISAKLKNQTVNTDKVQLIDRSCSCNCDLADFTCYVDIRPDAATASSNTEPVQSLESTTNTESIPLAHITTQTDVLNLTGSRVDVSTTTVRTEWATRAINTNHTTSSDKSISCSYEVADFSCIADIRPHTSTAASCTDCVRTQESASNTLPVQLTHIATQAHVLNSDVYVTADLPLPSQAPAKLTERRDVHTDCSEEVCMSACRQCASGSSNTITVQNCFDAATDTDDLLTQPLPLNDLKNEIGTYVGQVEVLLEEQQSLLADKYKELEDVLDEKESDEHDPKVRAKPETSTQKIPVPEKEVLEIAESIDPNKYMLSDELRSARTILSECLKNPDAFSQFELENAISQLQDEWFSLSTVPSASPASIEGFVEEIAGVPAVLLAQIFNTMDSSGNSALHYAISHENFPLIITLISLKQLDVNLFNNAGYTASMLAAITHVETDFEAQILDKLFKEADVNLHAKQAGQTALMLAVSHGCLPAARSLLKAGANVNAQDEDGSTALMCATEHKHAELVKMLLSHPDCDPTIADHDGSTAINIALEAGQGNLGMLIYASMKLRKSNS